MYRKANKYCTICRRIKSRHRRHERRLIPAWSKLKEFGEIVTAYHFDVKSETRMSVRGHKWGMVGLDLHSGFIMARPAFNKNACETSSHIRNGEEKTE